MRQARLLRGASPLPGRGASARSAVRALIAGDRGVVRGEGGGELVAPVAPRDEVNVYNPAFRRVKQSVQLR